MIHIEVPGQLQHYCKGNKTLSSSARTVGGVLKDLETRYPDLYGCVCDETGAVRRHINLFINTIHLRERDGLATELTAGDIVFILPAVSGG